MISLSSTLYKYLISWFPDGYYNGLSTKTSHCWTKYEAIQRLVNLSKIPVLLVTSEVSYDAVYDYCTIEYVKQAGVDVQWSNSSAVGTPSNAHFLFLKKNNQGVAVIVEKWIRKPIWTSESTPVTWSGMQIFIFPFKSFVAAHGLDRCYGKHNVPL